MYVRVHVCRCLGVHIVNIVANIHVVAANQPKSTHQSEVQIEK